MAFKPNYNQQRAERDRAKQRKKQEKLQEKLQEKQLRQEDDPAGSDAAPAEPLNTDGAVENT